MKKFKTYGFFILSIIFAVIGHFKVSGSIPSNGVEVYSDTTALQSISTGVLLGGFVFFIGIGMLSYSVYNYVKENA